MTIADPSVGWTDRLIAILAHTSITPVPVDEEFARREGPRGTVLTYREWKVDGLGELRATDILGPKLRIHATMLYPNDSEVQPVFAAELVVLGTLVRAAVADIQPLTHAAQQSPRLREALAETAPRTARWRASEAPDWCTDHFTEAALLSLKRTEAELEELESVYDAIAEAFVRMELRADPKANPATAEYKHHHFVHTPGRKYMSAAFGVEWTEKFLAEGMYR